MVNRGSRTRAAAWERMDLVELSQVELCRVGLGGHGRRSVRGPLRWPGADLFQRDGGWSFEMLVHGVLAARQALDSLPRTGPE